MLRPAPAAHRPPAAPRRGAAVVEMAMVAPVLFLLIIGAIEFGRAMMVTNVLSAAAREGARSGVVPGGANSDITTAVSSYLTSNGINASRATITVQVNGTTRDASTAVNGDTVSVNVTIQYADVCWLPTPFFITRTAALGGQAVMRHE